MTAPVKRGKCPRCGKTFDYTSVKEHKAFPFCSARCRDIDLGNWLSDKYVITGEAVHPPENLPHEEEV